MTTFIRLTQSGTSEPETIDVNPSRIGTMRRLPLQDATLLTVDDEAVWVLETPDEIMSALGLTRTDAPVAPNDYVMPEEPTKAMLHLMWNYCHNIPAKVLYENLRALVKACNRSNP